VRISIGPPINPNRASRGGILPGESDNASHDDILVARKHADLIRAELEGLIEPKPDEDPGLGLARLSLKPGVLLEAQRHFRSDDPHHWDPNYESRDEKLFDALSLDSILRGLRARLEGRFAGWTPEMGKNRVLGVGVGGEGKISGGAGGPVRRPPTAKAFRDRRLISRTAQARGGGARIALLDTPIWPNSWLAGAWTGRAGDVLATQTAQEATGLPKQAGHATFVAGLALKAASGCTITVRGVLDENGLAASWDVAKAMVELGRTGQDVLNLSVLCFTEDGQPPFALRAAIDKIDANTVIVAAAGNHGAEQVVANKQGRAAVRPAWPAAFDRVLAVGSVDASGSPSAFTPQHVEWIDAYANGEDVLSTYLTGKVLGDLDDDESGDYHGYARWSGTSFAAAKVSGAIAAQVKPGEVSAQRAWASLAAGARRRAKSAPLGGNLEPNRPVITG
jgi:hypothetical protein